MNFPPCIVFALRRITNQLTQGQIIVELRNISICECGNNGSNRIAYRRKLKFNFMNVCQVLPI